MTNMVYDPLLIGIHGVSQAGKDVTFSVIENWLHAKNEAEGRGITARKRGFADKLKWTIARMFFPKITMDEAIVWVDRLKLDKSAEVVITRYDEHNDEDVTEAALTMRDVLRHFGTEAMRDIHGDEFWTDSLLPIPMGVDQIRHPQWHQEFLIHEYGIHQDFSPEADPEQVRHAAGHVADVCGITDLRFPNEVTRIKIVGGGKAQLWKVRNDEATEKIIAAAAEQGRELHRSDLELPDDLFDVILDNSQWRTRPEYLGEQVAPALEALIS